jgi:hypothetical protein
MKFEGHTENDVEVMHNSVQTVHRMVRLRASLHLSVSKELLGVGPMIDGHVIVRQHPRIVNLYEKMESKLVEVGN